VTAPALRLYGVPWSRASRCLWMLEEIPAEFHERELRVLDDALEADGHLVGSRFTVADLNVANMFNGPVSSALDLGAHPHVRSWLDACRVRPAAQRVLERVRAEFATRTRRSPVVQREQMGEDRAMTDLKRPRDPYDRPSFEHIYLELARLLAMRSTCRRLRVGTVITTTDHRRVLAVGYNGNATGFDNDCDRDEAGNCGCLHSEENACINCDSPRSVEKYVFVTHLPCPMCAKRLVNLGSVVRVTFSDEYRSAEGQKSLEAAGIEVVHAGPPDLTSESVA